MSLKDKIVKLEAEKKKVEDQLVEHFRKEASEELKKKILEYKDLVDPIVLKNVFGIKTTRTSTKSRESKKLSQRATKVAPNVVPKEPFYNSVSQRAGKLKKGDHLANVAAKILLFMVKNHEKDNLMMEMASNFKKAKEDETQDRHDLHVKQLYVREKKKDDEKKKTGGKNNLLKYGLIAAGGVGLMLFAEDAMAAFTDMKKQLDGFNLDIKSLFNTNEIPTTLTNVNSMGDLSNLQQLKDVIGKAESGNNYNRLVTAKAGDKNLPSEFKNINLSDLTIAEVLDLQKRMKKSGLFPSTAIGKFQIVEPTLKSLSSSLGVDINKTKFTPETQEMYADKLIKDAGYEDYKTGKITGETLQNNLAKIWAAVPVSRDMVVDDKFGHRELKAGQSYYATVGGNKAMNTGFSLPPLLNDVSKSKPIEVAKNVGTEIEKKSRDMVEVSGNKLMTYIVEKQTILPLGGDYDYFVTSTQVSDDRPNVLRDYTGQ